MTVAGSFGLGFCISDGLRNAADAERAEQLKQLVRSCPQYIVMRLDGSMECRALMPRFSFDPWLHPEPLPKKPTLPNKNDRTTRG